MYALGIYIEGYNSDRPGKDQIPQWCEPLLIPCFTAACVFWLMSSLLRKINAGKGK